MPLANTNPVANPPGGVEMDQAKEGIRPVQQERVPMAKSALVTGPEEARTARVRERSEADDLGASFVEEFSW